MTKEEEATLSRLLELKRAEDSEIFTRRAAEEHQARLDREKYNDALWLARKANQRAHAEAPQMPPIITRPSGFEPCKRHWGPDELKSDVFYLCLNTSVVTTDGTHWFIGTAYYYTDQKRWIMHGDSYIHQAEALLQIHEIDLPLIAQKLVEFPKVPENVKTLMKREKYDDYEDYEESDYDESDFDHELSA